MTTALAELKQAAIVNGLRSCQLFAGMPSSELGSIAEITVVKTVPKGSYLFHEGDPSHGYYIVQTGAINVHRVNAVGKEQVIHVFRAGESFAEGTLATDKGYELVPGHDPHVWPELTQSFEERFGPVRPR